MTHDDSEESIMTLTAAEDGLTTGSVVKQIII